MSGPLFQFLAEDHARLDALLQRAASSPGQIDRAAYAEFRAGLLKHISMEEKLLFPAARRARGGDPLPLATKLRLDHGALAALLVPTPTPGIIAALRTILAAHNEIEEGPGGVYETCEQLVGKEAAPVLTQLSTAPEAPVSPHFDGSRALGAARRALARAGYECEI
ncbi:MAG: hemerythrin domain-containing protein [Candidatus Binatia bacterium]